MKSCFFTLAASVMTVALVSTSCDFLKTGYDMNDPAEVQKIYERIGEHIDADAAIYELDFHFRDKLELYPTTVVVKHTRPGQEEQSSTTIGLGRDDSYVSEREKPISESMRRTMGWKPRDPATGIKLADLDLSLISDNVNTAARMIKDSDLPFSGIEAYTLTVKSADPADIVHNFSLSSRTDSKTVAGNRGLETHISYNIYEFEADAQGNVEIVPGDE